MAKIDSALAGASINIITMLLLIGFFGYQLVVLPEVIEKLDRGYGKIIQISDIQNQTAQRNMKIFGALFIKIANNTETTVNNTNAIVSLVKKLDDRAVVQNAYRNETQTKLDDAINQTNTLVKFLSDNFGAKSGYLERENFQYAQNNQSINDIKLIKAKLGITQ